ncbi:uncharacterized protein isoform X3 [Rhodnius prolixus]|uniref:uncharacterized protein isoform X3 n=1 Tax=Rhodnius prolixus TaxID=13249 RepID=UPI003D187E11
MFYVTENYPCRSEEMEPSPKRPRIQAVELSPTPKILPLATSDLLPDKNGNAPVPPSEPELITGEVTLEDSIIKAIYNRPKLWMETAKGQEDEVEKLWTEVAKEVRRGVYIVKQIWQHLQRKFFEELINMEKLKIKTSNWQYFDRLSFLKLENQSTAADSSGRESIITVLPTGYKVGNNATYKVLMNDTNSINKVINNSTKLEQTNRVPKVPIPKLQKAVNLGNSLTILHTTSTNTLPLANNQSIKIYKNPKLFYKNVGSLAGGGNKDQRTFIRIPGKNDLKSGNHKATGASSKENFSFQLLPPEKDLTLVATNSGAQKNAESNSRSGLNEPKSPDKSGASLLRPTPSNVLSSPQFSKKNVIVVSKDDLAFFNGLLPRVKLLPDSAKQQFRWKVLKVLSEIEKNNLDGKVTNLKKTT